MRNDYEAIVRPDPPQREPQMILSCREIAILRLSSQGKTASEIAAAMAVTERTANFHIGNAIQKLGAANKTHAVVLAMRLGVLD